MRGKRVALLAHPASVTRDLTHALDALAALPDVNLTAAFGPQHGLRGDKQDNMVESPDFTDPEHGIPVFSLYGAVRRPTSAMLSTFDVLLVDLQDVGCRIYTFITTLRYVLEEAARHGKAVWVLDRPNPVGPARRRADAARRLGELRRRRTDADAPRAHDGRARALVRRDAEARRRLPRRRRWKAGSPTSAPGYGWPLGERSWVNPSPNVPKLSIGALLSRHGAWSRARRCPKAAARRGRSSSFGAPDIDAQALIDDDARARAAMAARLHAARVLVRADVPQARRQAVRRRADPRRRRRLRVTPRSGRGVCMALAFKALRTLEPKYPLWRDFPYEYERGRLAIDLINGSDLLREWVDDRRSTPGDLDALALADEKAWRRERRAFLLY